MASFPVFLCFMAVLFPLFPAHGQEDDIHSLSTIRKEIQKEIVDKHNELRRSVYPTASNMLKMQWSEEAAANAQKWADKCIPSQSTNKYRKLNTTNCGENNYMSTPAATWSSTIETWYNESKYFIFGVGPEVRNAFTGHFTQVVWHSSSLVGCAFSYCPYGYDKYNFVCHYCPAGNVQGRINYPYIIGPTCADCPNDCDNGLCTQICKYQDYYSSCKSLVASMGCKHDIIQDNCKATCECQNKIY